MSEGGPEISEAELVPTPEVVTPEWFVNLSEQEDYKNSVLIDELKLQAQIVGWDSLGALFSDIDGTLTYKLTKGQRALPPEKQAEIFLEYTNNVQNISERLKRKHRPFISVTGRGYEEVRNGQGGGKDFSTEGLPMFPVFAEGVGTTIYVLQKDGTYKQDEEWNRIIREDIQFDRDYIYQHCCIGLINEVNTDARKFNLHFQPRDAEINVNAWKVDPDNKDSKKPEKKPQEKKISFHWEGMPADVVTMRKYFTDKLASTDVNRPKVEVVISHDRTLDNGNEQYNVDLVPVTKDGAIQYMTKKFGLKYPAVAGDSGNDWAMIQQGKIGIIPGGSKAELLQPVETLITGDRVDKQTRHFTTLRSDENSTESMIYRDNQHGSRNASSSVERAVRGLELLDTLRDKNT